MSSTACKMSPTEKACKMSSTEKAYKIILDYIGGADMKIIIYVPLNEENKRQIFRMKSELGESERENMDISIVPMKTAKFHSQNFIETGCADVEECIFIDTLKTPLNPIKYLCFFKSVANKMINYLCIFMYIIIKWNWTIRTGYFIMMISSMIKLRWN